MATSLQLNNLRTLKSCRLCIICAKSKEASIVKERWYLKTKISGKDVAELPKKFEGYEFFTGSFKLDNGSSLSFYVTHTSRQGIQSFAAEAAILFTILKPTYAVLVGVCAAISGKGFEPKDVIFGEKALNYEEGKWEIKAGQPKFRADVKTVDAHSATMGGFIETVKGNGRSDWKLGDYISGCAVRLDANKIFKRVAGHTLRNAGALEMEASAFLQVCDSIGVHAFGVIKGVSDMGDEHKGLGHDNFYTPALENAADATKAYIKYKLPEIVADSPDIGNEPGAVIAPGYFNTYLSKVIEKLKDVKHVVEVRGEKVKIAGIKVVMPEDDDASLFLDAYPSAVEGLYNEYEMDLVTLPKGSRPTTFYVKHNYVFDFPTTIGNSLINHPNQPQQIGYFRQTLSKLTKPHKLVQIMTWKEFRDLLEELNKPPQGAATVAVSPTAEKAQS